MAESLTDPFDYLEKDHRKVEELFSKLEDTTENAEKTREELFGKLDEALTLHAKVEEEVLYPALEELKKTHEITMEAFEEHHVMKVLLMELRAMPVGSEEWTAKLTVLQENVEHHVEEEEGEMFKKARQGLDGERQEQLAKQMEEFLAT